MSESSKKLIQELLNGIDIQINGSRPWDIQVHNEELYDRILDQKSLGFGEAYMEKWWDCADLAELFRRILTGKLNERLRTKSTLAVAGNYLKVKLTNRQSRRRAKKVGKVHYDISPHFFRQMLGETIAYSCGYWKNAKTLDEAQKAKLDLSCKKLNLKTGMRVLDIGCGWGSFAEYAARKYEVEVVGITISKSQAEFAQKRCAGLPVKIRLQDWRDVHLEKNEKPFDAVVSIGMFEHVGPKNYRPFMLKVRSLIEDNGLFLLHTIGGNKPTKSCDPWYNKYIFPEGVLPFNAEIDEAILNTFIMEDWHNFGYNYSLTLHAWLENFVRSWPEFKDDFDDPERFYRMWSYYLLSLVGGFEARHMQLWQIVLSPNGVRGGYESIR